MSEVHTSRVDGQMASSIQPMPDPYREADKARAERARSDVHTSAVGDDGAREQWLLAEQEITRLFEALADERDFADRLVAELKEHGWGDLHYGTEVKQDPDIVALLDEHRSRREGKS